MRRVARWLAVLVAVAAVVLAACSDEPGPSPAAEADLALATQNSNTEVAASPTQTLTPPPAEAPVGEVDQLRLTSPVRGLMRVNWNAAEYAPADYHLTWARADEDWPAPSDIGSNAYPTLTSHIVTGLDAGAIYKVRVRARHGDAADADSIRNGPWSRTVRVRVIAPPLAPTGVTAVATPRGVMLRWDDPADDTIVSYELVRAFDVQIAAAYVVQTGSAETQYFDSGTLDSVQYVYTLRAINNEGRSPDSKAARVTTLARISGRDDLYEQIRPPVHAASVQWYWDRELDPIREMTVDFTVHNNVYDFSPRNGFYLMLLNGRISDVTFYFGFQTAISHAGAPRVKGVIFSRWDTRDLGNARVAPDGWSQSAGYEGDFIGVRRAYDWGAGRYHARIAPDGLEADGEWYSVWITNRDTNETTWIGSLKFPLIDGAGAINAISYSTLELYGLPTRPIDTPEWYVTISAPLADGVPPVRLRTYYPYDDDEGRAMLNSNSLFDAQEGIAHLRIGGTTERMTPTAEHDLSP